MKAMGIYEYVTIVPYDGGSACETALQGNHIQLEVSALSDASNYIAAGSTIPVMVCNTDRIDALPDVSSTVENGFNVTYAKPRGFFAPAGTDPAILEYLSGKIAEVCEMPEYAKAMGNFGFTVAYVDGPEAKECAVAWAEALKPVFEEMAALG